VFRPPFFFDDGELTINTSDEYLTYEDALALEQQCEFVTYAIPQVEHSVRASVGYEGRHVTVMGTSPSFSPGMKWFTRLGRSMRYSDADSEAKVCILGLQVARYLFHGTGDPVGREIRLDDTRYVVAGVMDDKDEDNDRRIIVPVTTTQTYMTGSRRVDHLWVKTTSIDTVDAARGEASAVLSQRHGGEAFFRTWSLKDILKYINKMIFVLQIAIGGLAATSLFVGGIGIMNVMLASVNERTYEVGLRKAVGARRVDIMFQFLIEAVVLSLLGGAGGIAVGVGVTRGVAWFMDTVAKPPQPWLPLVSTPAVVFAIAACACVGLFFGIYPARKAALLPPVEALRRR
jgi:putative ABC transport system permease protein